MQEGALVFGRRRLVLLTFISWLSMLAFDLFLHAGLLAGLYMEPSPFLLPPMEAFRRIPLGYLSFLVLAILLAWFMTGARIRGWKAGLLFGLKTRRLDLGVGSTGSAFRLDGRRSPDGRLVRRPDGRARAGWISGRQWSGRNVAWSAAHRRTGPHLCLYRHYCDLADAGLCTGGALVDFPRRPYPSRSCIARPSRPPLIHCTKRVPRGDSSRSFGMQDPRRWTRPYGSVASGTAACTTGDRANDD